MGWFWNDSKANDPTKKLDPGLRDYLQQESPDKYTPAAAPSPAPESHPPSTSLPEPSQSESSQSAATEETKPAVPSASLFPDGRYAHLWKNYQTPADIELTSKRPGERVVDQFKRRKDLLNRAAVENCAEEQEILTHCFKRGSLQNRMWARVTLCSAENRDFGRCYTMQGVR